MVVLLSVFSKLLEKLVYNRIITFIEKNGIITEAEHGFRSKRSTETALLDFINNVRSAIDNLWESSWTSQRPMMC
jgi:hypothetical protein